MLACTASLVLAAAAEPLRPPELSFDVFARTGHALDAILWTGSSFVYVENTANTLWTAPPAGTPLTELAAMPRLVEETRCVASPGAHGFPAGAIFCQSPDHKLYELPAGSTDAQVFATLPAPYPPASDGALDFDRVGRFGYRLIAATGRSGNARPSGGTVYAVGPSGAVTTIGGYRGPGGADELMVAPGSFGSAAGDVLLTVDAGAGAGALLAMSPDGRTRALGEFRAGLNPIAAIPPRRSGGGAPAAGLYVTDDESPNVYFAPAAELAPFAGDLVVGAENRGAFWIVAPEGAGFTTTRLATNLRGGHYSLEGCAYIG